MRTTLNIAPPAFELAQAYAQARAIKLGDAISELVLRGAGHFSADASAKVQVKPAIKKSGGTWVMQLPKATPTMSAAQVKQLLEDE